MAESPWLSRSLHWSAMTAAAALAALVLIAPFLEPGATAGTWWQRVLAVFARNTLMRRGALASALGLAATPLPVQFHQPVAGGRAAELAARADVGRRFFQEPLQGAGGLDVEKAL